MTAYELMQIRPGSAEYDGLKLMVAAGNAVAAKCLVLTSVWNNLRKQKDLSIRSKVRLFHQLVKADLVNVEIERGR